MSFQGDLVYANYGTRRDIEFITANLPAQSCKDNIVIMRYGEISRAEKVTTSLLTYYSILSRFPLTVKKAKHFPVETNQRIADLFQISGKCYVILPFE